MYKYMNILSKFMRLILIHATDEYNPIVEDYTLSYVKKWHSFFA
jgi:hypothetical protein